MLIVKIKVRVPFFNLNDFLQITFNKLFFVRPVVYNNLHIMYNDIHCVWYILYMLDVFHQIECACLSIRLKP